MSYYHQYISCFIFPVLFSCCLVVCSRGVVKCVGLMESYNGCTIHFSLWKICFKVSQCETKILASAYILYLDAKSQRLTHHKNIFHLSNLLFFQLYKPCIYILYYFEGHNWTMGNFLLFCFVYVP